MKEVVSIRISQEMLDDLISLSPDCSIECILNRLLDSWNEKKSNQSARKPEQQGIMWWSDYEK